jgi:hypothetical protein
MLVHAMMLRYLRAGRNKRQKFVYCLSGGGDFAGLRAGVW